MTYEHQERYRRRTLLKARYFDEANAERLAPDGLLRRSIAKQFFDKPEIRACVPFFLSHPRAVEMPVIGFDEDRGPAWYLCEGPEPRFSIVLAVVALTEVSSLRVDAWLRPGDADELFFDRLEVDDPRVDQVRKEIEELRACGMWVTE